MQNPTICHSIRSKLITKEDGLAIEQVNPDPVQTIHLQRCWSDNTTVAAIQKSVTEPFGTQYGGTVANVVSTPPRTATKRFELTPNTIGIIATVRLTLITNLNEEVEEVLTTNGTNLILTAGANYKVLNDMVIISDTVLTGSERIRCRPQGGTQNNVHLTIGATFKYNPIFMCGNKNGVVRNARLIGIPQFHSANTSVGLRLIVFGNSSATSAPKLTFNNVQGTINNLSADDTVTLVPGEWCIFHRNTGSSINTAISVTAQWEIYNA